jgi:hypothetical protein
VTIKSHIVAQPDSTYPVIIKPYRVHVSRLGAEELDESEFAITNVSDEDMKINIVSEPFGYLNLDIPKVVKAGETVDCMLKVNPEYLDEAWQKSITLELGDAGKTRFTIPVIRKIIGNTNKSAASTKPGTTAKAGGGKK